jgi:hypothetical protein
VGGLQAFFCFPFGIVWGLRWGEVAYFEKREHDTQNRDVLETRNEDLVFARLELKTTDCSK